MISVAGIALCGGFLSSTSLHGASEIERELEQTKKTRDKAIAEANDPINRRYRMTLEQLLRRATQANDLAAALRIQQAIGELDPSSLAFRLQSTRWTRDEGSGRVQFKAGGTFVEDWSKGRSEGKWEPLSETEATVAFKSGQKHVYRMSPDGETITRAQWPQLDGESR